MCHVVAAIGLSVTSCESTHSWVSVVFGTNLSTFMATISSARLLVYTLSRAGGVEPWEGLGDTSRDEEETAGLQTVMSVTKTSQMRQQPCWPMAMA